MVQGASCQKTGCRSSDGSSGSWNVEAIGVLGGGGGSL